jgi:hypothetical protein
MPVPGVRNVAVLVDLAVRCVVKSWPCKTVETDPIAVSFSPGRFFEIEAIGSIPTRRLQSLRSTRRPVPYSSFRIHRFPKRHDELAKQYLCELRAFA